MESLNLYNISQNGITDLAFANLFVVPKRKKHIDLLQPYKADYICFLVKKPPPNPKWKDLMIPFHQELWFVIFISLILCTLVVSVINGILLQKGFRLQDDFINVLATFLDQSIPFCGKIK